MLESLHQRWSLVGVHPALSFLRRSIAAAYEGQGEFLLDTTPLQSHLLLLYYSSLICLPTMGYSMTYLINGLKHSSICRSSLTTRHNRREESSPFHRVDSQCWPLDGCFILLFSMALDLLDNSFANVMVQKPQRNDFV